MAYIITNDDTKTNIYRIAENDSAKDNLPDLSASCVANTISDSDFANLKNNTKIVSGHDGNNYTYEDSGAEFAAAENLTHYLNDLSKVLASALERYPSHVDATVWTNYKNVIDGFDTSSISFPLNKSWEKHCEDSSITYVNVLQLP